VADKGGSRGPQSIAISTHLPDEEAAARIFLQVLRMHGHIADEEDGLTCNVKDEGHQGTEWKSRMLTGQGREGADRDLRQECPDTFRVGWLRKLR
jgi:hypothetical protein